jgi:hypothetical protein
MWGGKVTFPVVEEDSHQVGQDSVVFKKHALRYMCGGTLIVLFLPFLCMPSANGFIGFNVPPAFLEKPLAVQYLILLIYGVHFIGNHVLGMEFFAEVPIPSSPIWTWVVLMMFAGGHILSFLYVGKGAMVLLENYKKLGDHDLNNPRAVIEVG